MSLSWEGFMKTQLDEKPQDCSESMRRALEEMNQLEKKQNEARDLRRKAKAIELGFSSWEEYSEHDDQTSRERDARFARFLKQLAEDGITEEDWYRNHLQLRTPQLSICQPMVGRGPCNCREHPISFFCHQALVELHSRDEPGLIEAREDRKRPQMIESIKIMPGDVSRRMPQEILERYWGMKSPELSMELTPWFKGDEVLQRIVDASSRSNAECLNGSSPSIEFSDSANTFKDPSTAPTSPGNELARDSQSPTQVSTSQVLEIKSKGKPDLRSKRTGTSQQSGSKSQPPKVLRTHERLLKKTTRIQKTALHPVLTTRSRNITKFYKLDSDGVARSYRDFAKSR